MLMETPSSPPPEHRSLLGLVLRLAALTLVAGLLALLVWRVVNAGQGGHLVNAVREHKKPIAPDFRLGVLWPPALDSGSRHGRRRAALAARKARGAQLLGVVVHPLRARGTTSGCIGEGARRTRAVPGRGREGLLVGCAQVPSPLPRQLRVGPRRRVRHL